MKWLRSHTAILSFFIVLLAGTGLSFLYVVEISSRSQMSPEFSTIAEKTSHVQLGIKLVQPASSDTYHSQLFGRGNIPVRNVSFSAENAEIPQPLYQHLFTDCDAFSADNMMAEVPATSVANPLQSSASSASPDKTGTDVLSGLVHPECPVFSSRIQQLPSGPFFKKIALLPMAGGVAIGAP